MRRASSVTPRGACGSAWSPSTARRSPSGRSAATCASVAWRSGRSVRRSCRSCTRRGSRARSTGARRGCCWAVGARRSICSTCGCVTRARRSRPRFSNETQQAFLEGHAEAFAFLGGVPALVRYDNLGSAVKQVLKGRRRVETDRFVALRSHFMFESQFTLVGLEGAHEKGGIEGEVGRFRRRHLVPVPDVASLAELNARLRAGCEHDLARRITGHPDTVGEALGARTAAAARAARRAAADRRAGHAARRRQGAGVGPSEPLLGAGRPRRAARDRDDRRARDHDRARRPAGRQP